ncbi:hypothetical protein MFMK1_000378 [Metallumcola ferriviriculae]|uniref:SLH domain-containing protein n=1 Tax=Metallumcola ferriviriculae TaxID=3039180 RepID=A0AAU0UJY3_9FIRM|nr:hypothetical protein MFMK1_000378 [Desulfitibacteraceae bacterium MK1]
MVKNFSVLLVMLLILTLPVAAMAAEKDDGLLTRGEFAAMLVEAANITGDAAPVDLLINKGILKGYPNGEMGLEEATTLVEAVTLSARTLGLQDGISPIVGIEVPLGEEHWGYALYSWFERQGLVSTEADPKSFLTNEQGSAFLNTVFSIDPKATEIVNKAQKNESELKTLRMQMEGSFTVIARADAPDAKSLTGSSISMVQEMEFPARLHQTATLTVQVPEQGQQEINTELYLVNGKFYQQTSNPETGETVWYRFPDDLMPNLDKLLEKQTQQLEAVPPELQEYMHYQLLGTKDLNGTEVYEIAFYGRIDDFNKFMEAASGQFGDMNNPGLSKSASMLKSMSYWGIEYIGVEDLLTYGSDYASFMNYAEEFNGEPIPIQSMEMVATITEVSFNEDFSIEVPQEALDAPELEIPTSKSSEN